MRPPALVFDSYFHLSGSRPPECARGVISTREGAGVHNTEHIALSRTYAGTQTSANEVEWHIVQNDAQIGTRI